MRSLFFILCVAMMGEVMASDLIMNPANRKTISLDGQWQIIVDPYDNGYYNYHMVPHTREGYFANQQPTKRSDRIEYHFSEDHVLQVPGDWNTQDAKLYYYEGTLWYKKDFDCPGAGENRIYVYFGAVNYECQVYLNGDLIGEHVGGFTSFNFEITDRVLEKGNFLVLRVNNARRAEGVPTINTDWWNYGGITRSVKIIEVPKTFIKDYMIQLEKGVKTRIAGWVRLDGSNNSQKVTISIPELRVKYSTQTNQDGQVSFSFKANLALWSPENPKLYQVILESETDRVEDRIGFRTIEATANDILLNGKPVFLRGICIHEEAPIRGGRACRVEDAKILLSWAKELGCNYVRLAHYPHNENMVCAADEIGLLVWSEIPVYWTVQFDNPSSYANAENQLTENISRDRNRAAIIFWSIANETPVGESRNMFLKKLADKARQLDLTRLITAASDKQSADGFSYTISDPICEFLDVIGVNEYIGWYDGLPEKCDHITWKRAYSKPVVISEMGGGALFGLHGDAQTRWSEEYQEDLYAHQIGMLKKMDFLRGVTPWILMDFRSPRRPLYGIQDGWNRKGLISNFGDKKKAFLMLQKWYKEIRRTGKK